MDRLGDRLNPIVVKELRQAVRSKFIVGALLLFLLVQASIIGIEMLTRAGRDVSGSYQFEAGKNLFGILQGILLGTCMLLLPLSTGSRLAAERSDLNVDLLFITTLRPRAIIAGKFLAAQVLALMIFSACAPFLTFTYLLRGVDVLSIVFVLVIDFAAVAVAVQFAIFLAVVPAHWVLKIILGLLGFGGLVFGFMGVLAGTLAILQVGGGYLAGLPDFWPTAACVAAIVLTGLGLLFTWSVALVSPPSANRALLWRSFLGIAWLAIGVVFGLADVLLPQARHGPLLSWALGATGLFCLNLMIAINEREQWAPRVARTIPRPRWLRGPAFLVYSSAAGGIFFSALMVGLTILVLLFWKEASPSSSPGPPRGGPPKFVEVFRAVAWMYLYTYAYALTAVFIRRIALFKIPATYTWIVLLVLLVLGCTVPYLILLIFVRDWSYGTHYGWLVTVPFVALAEAFTSGYRTPVFLAFAASWAGVVTLLNLPWYWRQIRGFRPYTSRSATPAGGELPLTVTAAQAAATKTVDKPSV
jgi:hypothetical protein